MRVFVKASWCVRRLSVSPLFASLFLVVILVVLCFADNSHGVMPDRVVAIVNNEAITLTDYRLFVNSIGLHDKGEMVDEGLLKKLIEEKIVLLEAKNRGIEVSDGEVDAMVEKIRTENTLSRDEMEKAFEGEGIGIQGFKRLIKEKLMALKLVESEVDSRFRVDEKEIEEFYHAHKREYVGSPAKVEVSAIFLKLSEGATAGEITDLKRKALRIIEELREGVSFDLLTVQYDDDYLKNDGGRLGEFERGVLTPPLDEKVFSMSEGETSEPIWLKEGMYILKVVNRTNEIYKALGEVKEEIRAYLSEEKREALLHAWIKTLWERASIKLQ